MHLLFEQASELTGTIIAASIEVHRALGPGLLESVYHWALTKELELRRLPLSTEQRVRIEYKGFVGDDARRYDILVQQCVLVEVRAVAGIAPIHKAQLLSYIKLLDVPLGLILNFHQDKLVDGIARVVLRNADR
jgi:GxxExxY protein